MKLKDFLVIAVALIAMTAVIDCTSCSRGSRVAAEPVEEVDSLCVVPGDSLTEVTAVIDIQ